MTKVIESKNGKNASDRQNSGCRVGIDVGGTFTDFQILDGANGKIYEFKAPTTPNDPSLGVTAGLKAAAKHFGLPLTDTEIVMHGTTIATNAVLEHKLPLGALVTTAGFEDVFEIGRHLRRHIYGLKSEERYVMIARPLRFGVRERVSTNGDVVEPLDERQIEELAGRLSSANVRCLAILPAQQLRELGPRGANTRADQ